MSQSDEQGEAINKAAYHGDMQEQKPAEQPAAYAIDEDDPHKVEKLSKLGHADNEAAEGTE
jgi:hypothetical protein